MKKYCKENGLNLNECEDNCRTNESEVELEN